MSYEAQTAAVHALDRLRLRAEASGRDADWTAYWEAVAKLEAELGIVAVLPRERADLRGAA